MSEKDFYLYIDGQVVKVSEEVYREYKRAEDKERYFMKRLKKGRFVVDEDGQTVTYLPSREASYEQLLEADWTFAAPGGDRRCYGKDAPYGNIGNGPAEPDKGRTGTDLENLLSGSV